MREKTRTLIDQLHNMAFGTYQTEYFAAGVAAGTSQLNCRSPKQMVYDVYRNAKDYGSRSLKLPDSILLAGNKLFNTEISTATLLRQQ